MTEQEIEMIVKDLDLPDNIDDFRCDCEKCVKARTEF